MKKNVFLFVVIIFILSCSGKESLGIDKTPPEKPVLIPHLGDTGDGGNESAPGANYYNTPDIELENNGIDAASGGNRIQIQWEHLTDSDIDIIEIYGFSEQEYIADTLNFATRIEIVDYSEQTLYNATALTNLKLFYFINAIDVDGNSTYSDTVCYRLLDKPLLSLPANNLTTSNMSEITFEWNEVTNALQYRLLIFIENNDGRILIWQKTPLDLEYLSVEYLGPDIEPGTTILWRVDAFGLTANNVIIEKKSYSVISGSESEERILIVE